METIFSSVCYGSLSSTFLPDDAQHAKEHNSQPEMQLDEVKSIASAKTATFISPEGWRFADSNMLPKHVKTMVVGKGEHEMPPSINLGYEEFNGTLKDYLKIVKKINESQGDKWSDLGTIETKRAQQASLKWISNRVGCPSTNACDLSRSRGRLYFNGSCAKG